MPYPQKNKPLLGYVNQAKRKCKFLIESHKLRKDEPELFSPLQPPAPVQSSLCWDYNKATKSDLYELLIALFYLGVITEDKVSISYARIVREFFRILNVPYDDELYSERTRILGRSTRKTVFLDKLRKTLLETSNK